MHEKKCSCQILEVEGKFVSSPGDIFIHLFVYLSIYLFIYFVMVKELLQKLKNNKLLKHLIKISLMSIKS